MIGPILTQEKYADDVGIEDSRGFGNRYLTRTITKG